MNKNTQNHQKLYHYLRKGSNLLNCHNRSELYKDVTHLMAELSLEYPDKDKLKALVDFWKTKEYAKINSNQQLNEHRKKHLQAGVDWITDALKWIIEEEFTRTDFMK